MLRIGFEFCPGLPYIGAVQVIQYLMFRDFHEGLQVRMADAYVVTPQYHTLTLRRGQSVPAVSCTLLNYK